MRVLGISCDYHDAAAALVVDGEVVAAAEEERFSRLKHDAALPERAIASCLAIGDVGADALDAVVFHEKPFLVASRFLAAKQRRGPKGLRSFVDELPLLVKRNLTISARVDSALRRLGARRPPPLQFCEHHLSHAAAAFLPSPFERAALITFDGIGEWATTTIGRGSGREVDLLEEMRFPTSIGLLYAFVTTWCGFQANDGEYKLMGLAPFGEPVYADALREVVAVHDDGSMDVDARRVRWWSSSARRSRELADLLGGPPRSPGGPLVQRDADLARSVQELTEEVVLRTARHAAERTGETDVCLAGGVALNCVANGRLVREGPFERVWVQPAAGDSGSAVGAALWWWHGVAGGERSVDDRPGPLGDAMRGARLGPRFDDDEIAAWLEGEGISYRRATGEVELCREVAAALAAGRYVGWFQGRMEFGPRALGGRSILADPRSPTAQTDLNVKVKGRESFRPFAPAVLWEHAAEWFDIDRPSPYMTVTFPVAAPRRRAVEQEPEGFVDRVRVPRSEVPACTHVDGSARVQTVHRELDARFHLLLEEFHAATGCPVLLNTSFNVADEPIVCTPADAHATAVAAGLDLLVVGDCLVEL